MTSSIQLPSGNSAIVLSTGDLIDPIHMSLVGLVKLGDTTFNEVMAWVAAERVLRAERQEQREAEMRQFHAETSARLAAAAAAQKERDEQPALMKDVRR
jgi:6-phosphogluconolactonase/glucosamine-6-phosphate isomerase/deaminase